MKNSEMGKHWKLWLTIWSYQCFKQKDTDFTTTQYEMLGERVTAESYHESISMNLSSFTCFLVTNPALQT